MANFSLANIMRLVVMILLAIAVAMTLCYDRVSSHNAVFVVLAGGLVVYITFVVGICSQEVDPELAQYTDIIGIGPTFGIGLYWIVVHATDNSQYFCGLVNGIASFAASIFMLLAAIFTSK